jgi:hypothetical protein
MVRIEPDATIYRSGDRLTVAVTIANGRNVGSVPFHLVYDPQVVEFVSPATEGPYLGSDGGLTVFLAAESGAGGEIVVGLSRLGEPVGVDGSGTLALFEFDAVGEGDCGFGFSAASVKDPDAVDLTALFDVIPAAVE